MGLSDYKLTFIIDADGRTAKQAINSLYADINKLGGGFTATFGGAIPLARAAGAAIAGIGLAAVGAGAALFQLTKATAEYGSAIFDVTEKTGLSAETVSALKYAAEQSGSSLEAISNGIAKFAKNYKGPAADLETELGKMFKQIAAAKPGFEQLTLAQKNFGKGGADLIPIIKSFNGNLPGLMDNLRKVGLLMSNEDAKAADEFGDTLDLLEKQAAELGRQFAFGLMPRATAAMNSISSTMATNKEAARDWGTTTGNIIGGVIAYWDKAKQAADSYFGSVSIDGQKPRSLAGMVVEGPALLALEQKGASIPETLPNLLPGQPTAQEIMRVTDRARSGPESDVERLRAAAAKRIQEREAAFKRELSAQSEQNQLFLKDNREAFAANQKAWEEKFLSGEETKERYRAASLKNIEDYQNTVRQLINNAYTIDAQGKSGTELQNVSLKRDSALTALDREVAAEKAGLEKTITDRSKAEDEKRAAAAAAANRTIIELGAAKTETLIKQFELLAAKEIITEKQKTEIIGQLRLQELEQRRALTDDAQQRALIDEQIKQFKVTLSLEFIDLSQREKAAQDELNKSWAKGAETLWNLSMAQAEYNAKQRDAMEAAKPMNRVIKDMDDLLGQAMDQMFQGVGAMVEQWVLYGETGPDAMRKVTAQVLASLAAQATVKALFYTAEGIAALFTDPAAASGYFAAAAIMGGIAAGSALAGRAVAGDSFKNQGSGSGSGSSYSNSGSPQQANMSPMSRASSTAFYSGRDAEIRRLSSSIDRLEKKISSMRPGDVLTAGAREKRGFIGDTVAKEIKSNAAIGRDILRSAGVR